VIDPQYGIAFTDPAHPGSDESQADKLRRHKKMRGPLRAAGFRVPAPDEQGLNSTARLDTGHTLSFFPYGDHHLLHNWTVEVGHPNAGPRGRHLEDLGTDDDKVPQRALEFLASPRGTRILRDIAAGTHEGNIARNKFHPLSLDQADREPAEAEPDADEVALARLRLPS
jgi:hypothetical protein